MQLYDLSTFWGRVKERMIANGLTVKSFSERLGESYKSMTNRISENRIPKKKGLVEAMAEELGCSVEYLMTGRLVPYTKKYSPDIEDMIFQYKNLNEDRKRLVRMLLDALTKQQESEYEEYKRNHPELFK